MKKEVYISFSGSKIPVDVTEEQLKKLIDENAEFKFEVTVWPNGGGWDAQGRQYYKVKVIMVDKVK